MKRWRHIKRPGSELCQLLIACGFQQRFIRGVLLADKKSTGRTKWWWPDRGGGGEAAGGGRSSRRRKPPLGIVELSPLFLMNIQRSNPINISRYGRSRHKSHDFEELSCLRTAESHQSFSPNLGSPSPPETPDSSHCISRIGDYLLLEPLEGDHVFRAAHLHSGEELVCKVSKRSVHGGCHPTFLTCVTTCMITLDFMCCPPHTPSPSKCIENTAQRSTVLVYYVHGIAASPPPPPPPHSDALIIAWIVNRELAEQPNGKSEWGELRGLDCMM